MKNNTKNIRKGITATLFAAIMMLSVLAVVPVVSATVTVYPDNRPGWESALCCGYAEEFFTDATLNPGVSVVSDNGYVDTGDGVWWDRLECPTGTTTTTWQFATPLTPLYGFGGNWDLAGPGGPGASIAVAIGGSWVNVGEIPNSYDKKFWGFVSTVPFSAVRLSSGSTSGWCETYELDNMVYAWDTTPPIITCPADVTVEQESAAGTVVPLTATATDNCDPDPTITSSGELAIYPLGSTVVTFTATDDSGISASCTTTVTVVDTIAPDISVTVSPDLLWPPNHKMVDIVAVVTVSDICDAAPAVVLTSITSDEPDNAIGDGDGNTINDIQGAKINSDDYEFQLRAERAGTRDGRVYTITYTVTDASGNSADGSATVVVPHDMD